MRAGREKYPATAGTITSAYKREATATLATPYRRTNKGANRTTDSKQPIRDQIIIKNKDVYTSIVDLF